MSDDVETSKKATPALSRNTERLKDPDYGGGSGTTIKNDIFNVQIMRLQRGEKTTISMDYSFYDVIFDGIHRLTDQECMDVLTSEELHEMLKSQRENYENDAIRTGELQAQLRIRESLGL